MPIEAAVKGLEPYCPEPVTRRPGYGDGNLVPGSLESLGERHEGIEMTGHLVRREQDAHRPLPCHGSSLSDPADSPSPAAAQHRPLDGDGATMCKGNWLLFNLADAEVFPWRDSVTDVGEVRSQ